VAIAPPAAAAADLAIIAFVGPEGRSVGETLDVRIEVFRFTERYDPDHVAVRFDSTSSNYAHADRLETGVYFVRYTIQSADIGSFGYLSIDVHVSEGTSGHSQAFPYLVEGAGGGPSGVFALSSRVTNRETIGPTLEPGETALMEVRSFWNGSLRDAGVINATVRKYPEGTTYENLTVTRSGSGLYQASFSAPPNTTNTSIFQVGFLLGEGYTAITTAQAFVVDPFPAWVDVRLLDSSHFQVKVAAGIAAPMAGALVNISGSYFSFGSIFNGSSFGTIGHDLYTNDSGGASVILDIAPDFGFSTILVNVSHGGQSVWRAFSLDPSDLAGGDSRPYGSGFLGWLDSDPTQYRRGQTAHLKYHFENGSTPAANFNVTYYWWRDSNQSVVEAHNATTDALGDLTISYTIPQDWGQGEAFVVRVERREGFGGYQQIPARFDPAPPGGDSDLELRVSRGALGAALHVEAVYTGRGDAVGAEAVAVVFPANLSGTGLPSTLALYIPPTSAVMSRQGNTFAVDIDLPKHYPTGEYTVAVLLSNGGAVENTIDAMASGNWTVVAVGPEGSLVDTGAGGGFLPGPSGIAAAAVAGVAAAIGRRRRE
jgi:hypothetical protein